MCDVGGRASPAGNGKPGQEALRVLQNGLLRADLGPGMAVVMGRSGVSQWGDGVTTPEPTPI